MRHETAIRWIGATLLALWLGVSTASAQLGVPGFLLAEGSDDFSFTGYALALGDFNADGIDDLVIGIPGLVAEGVGLGQDGRWTITSAG